MYECIHCKKIEVGYYEEEELYRCNNCKKESVFMGDLTNEIY